MALVLSYSAIAGKDQFRSGILASLSLITRYHLTIIWAIEELERKHKPRDSERFYSEEYYYQMLVRKPAQKPKSPSLRRMSLQQMLYPRPRQTLSEPVPGSTFGMPDELVDDMARLNVVTPGPTLPFVFFPPTRAFSWVSSSDSVLDIGESGGKRKKTGAFGYLTLDEAEKKQKKEQQRRDSLRQRQKNAGREDPELTFFISMESDAMSNPNVEQCSASSDVSGDYSISPHFSPQPFGSPQPHILPHARKRSAKTRYDGFFVGDSCRAIERKSLSHKGYFGPEYQDQVYFFHRRLATAREDRESDFLEIKFRVYDHPPAYQFGLKEEMLCNVYHVRGRYYELCAPYTMPLDASLAELSRSRYTPLDESIAKSFYRRQVNEDDEILNLLEGFERVIQGQLENHFVAKGQQYRVDDGTIYPKRVTCIGRGQCAVVWQPGQYNLAFRRYAGHSEQSALQQAWIQQASYALYEQLSVARDPEKGSLKLEEDIGLVPPMSLASTRVYSRFVPLRSADGSYSLYEIQPKIPNDELVEYYIDLLIKHGTAHRVEVPLYAPKLNANIRTSDLGVASLGEIMTLIMEEILSQLETVTDNLALYLESRGPGSLNIGIDPKVANYQVRFSDAARIYGQQDLVAFLSNYDGYPPNLLLFSNKDAPEKSVLFRGGELSRLLNEYFGMYGFTKAFVGRTLKLNTLDKQVLKMLASIAGEIDSKFEAQRQEHVKRQVLPFFLNVVNKWMAERAARNRLSPPEPINIDKIFAYQRDSALYHRAFRLHLLAAEVGSMVNPERYSLPRAEFPVSDEQSDWLERQKQRYLLHMIAFFAVDDIDGLQELLMGLLDEKYQLSYRVLDFLDALQQLFNEQGLLLNHVLQVRDFETLVEIINDAFEAQTLPDEGRIAQPFGASIRRVEHIWQCRFSGGCVHSAQEHSLHHLLLRRMYLIRSSMVFSGLNTDADLSSGVGAEQFDYRGWLEMLRGRNVQLRSWSVHSTRMDMFSTLLQIPRARLLAIFRNTHNRLKRRQDVRIPEQERLLNQLQRVLQQSVVEDPQEYQTLGLAESNRNTILLASLLLDRPFVWIVPPRKTYDYFRIGFFRLDIDEHEKLTMKVRQAELTVGQLEQMVLHEQANGVKHYYVMANPQINEWTILVPEGTEGLPRILDNPGDQDDPLLYAVSSPAKKKRGVGTGGLSEDEHQRRLRYNSELRTFLANIQFNVANTPSDHFCLLHGLTVILNAAGKNETIESLKRKLRIFIAKLLVKIELYPHEVTLQEHQLIQQFGLTFLLDMLDELFMSQGGGGAHQNHEVWGDFNLILLTAVAFQMDIPFVNLNIEHWQDVTEPTVQFNVAQANGTVTQFNPHQQLPDIFIFFDEHPLQHWNLAFNPAHANQINPILHWLPSSLPPEEDMFAMDDSNGIELRDIGNYGLSHEDLNNPSHFDFSSLLDPPVPFLPQPMPMGPDQGFPFMTAPATAQHEAQHFLHQAVLPDMPMAPQEATDFNPNDLLVPANEVQNTLPPHSDHMLQLQVNNSSLNETQSPPQPELPEFLQQANNPQLNLITIASMFVLGATATMQSQSK